MTEDGRAARRAALRRRTLELVGGVVLLDALALGLYYLAGISTSAPRTRTIFTVAWTVATAVTVAVLLKRVRAARLGKA
jgi:hypothetical protein